ncbi:hypothetical protein RJT34_20108 [Clitoria ternatea]|uniref:Terpene synthase N-terminal domain-containing protein n=1 Tax=Clitoria ternatea TaxID=43366 RepID=A0AAN9ISS2_CLITE
MASHVSSSHCHLPHYSSSSSSNHFSSSSSSLPLHHFSKSSLHDNDAEYQDVFKGSLATLKLREINVEDDIEKEQEIGVLVTREIKKRVDTIKWILGSMEDGEISASAYNTAWVALVEDVEGSDSPQFPSSLEWIAKNQLPDGSWDNTKLFSAHDRLINTFAYVIALKSWNMHPKKCEKGMGFFRENLGKLEKENTKHMPIGFEVAFPSLLDMAHGLGIQVPDNSPILNKIFAMRSAKLTRIPSEVMHKVPTSLLHSLEGMSGLNWKQLLKLQSHDRSFLFSPSSTAFALMQIKDQNCLIYLNNVVNKFNGGDIGLKKGICWERNSNVQDIDDTAMGFRLLRLQGYQMSARQTTQAVMGIFNLFRASKVMFPGEKILKEVKKFSGNVLREKREENDLVDKWIIMKNLAEEVAYALDVSWYASLPRVETRFYIDQYSGESDVWIAKTLYRMAYVNNNNYLELAKLDYNNCQALHLTEWGEIQKWYSEFRLREYGMNKRTLLLAYFLVATSMFEPEKSHVRLAWAKTLVLIETITYHVSDVEMRKSLVKKFSDCINKQDYTIGWRLNRNKTEHGLAETLIATIDEISWDILVSQGHEIGYDMHCSELKSCNGAAYVNNISTLESRVKNATSGAISVPEI